jgi:hypothetical protein
VVAFGEPGRETIRHLMMNAPDREIRRTAASLSREFGGPIDARELAPLLTDSEPLVQREAVRALVLTGSATRPRGSCSTRSPRRPRGGRCSPR